MFSKELLEEIAELIKNSSEYKSDELKKKLIILAEKQEVRADEVVKMATLFLDVAKNVFKK